MSLFFIFGLITHNKPNICLKQSSIFSKDFLECSSHLPQKPPIPTTVNVPEVKEDEPQDGSEIKPDSTVVIINEEAPIFEDESPEDFEKEEEPVVIPDPIPDPDPIPTDPTPTDTNEEEPPVDEPVAPPKPKGKYLWCLDNGHGKLTAGKRSPVLKSGKRFFEYEFNRDIVRRIKEALDEHEVNYFDVVPEVDIDNFLEGRVARANAKKSELPKIFLSIHSNAGPARSLNHWSTASGIETWYFHGSVKGRKLASTFQKELMSRLPWKNRNIRAQKRNQFYVLRNTKMPAVLTENGFYNNEKEVALLNTEEIRQKIADAHVAAILHIEKHGI